MPRKKTLAEKYAREYQKETEEELPDTVFNILNFLEDGEPLTEPAVEQYNRGIAERLRAQAEQIREKVQRIEQNA